MLAAICKQSCHAGREEELKVQRATQLRQLQEAAGQLSMRRREGGKKLKAAVESCLGSLAMAASHFAVELAWRPTQQVILLHEELGVAQQCQGPWLHHTLVWS